MVEDTRQGRPGGTEQWPHKDAVLGRDRHTQTRRPGARLLLLNTFVCAGSWDMMMARWTPCGSFKLCVGMKMGQKGERHREM